MRRAKPKFPSEALGISIFVVLVLEVLVFFFGFWILAILSLGNLDIALAVWTIFLIGVPIVVLLFLYFKKIRPYEKELKEYRENEYRKNVN